MVIKVEPSADVNDLELRVCLTLLGYIKEVSVHCTWGREHL